MTIDEIPECIKKDKRITTARKENQRLDYEAFTVQNSDHLNGVIRYYDKIDEEGKETIFDSDFIL